MIELLILLWIIIFALLLIQIACNKKSKTKKLIYGGLGGLGGLAVYGGRTNCDYIKYKDDIKTNLIVDGENVTVALNKLLYHDEGMGWLKALYDDKGILKEIMKSLKPPELTTFSPKNDIAFINASTFALIASKFLQMTKGNVYIVFKNKRFMDTKRCMEYDLKLLQSKMVEMNRAASSADVKENYLGIKPNDMERLWVYYAYSATNTNQLYDHHLKERDDNLACHLLLDEKKERREALIITNDKYTTGINVYLYPNPYSYFIITYNKITRPMPMEQPRLIVGKEPNEEEKKRSRFSSIEIN